MTPFLQANNLSKNYQGLKAVDGISFSIEQGRCFGLLGPNGAGKTTTVEMLEGINQPTEGEVLYLGKPLGRRFRDEAGIMFQSTSLQDYITVHETLEMFQQLYPRTVPLPELIKSCSLDGFLHQDTRKLSGGQRQRLLLAIALVNDPEVIFLDEPTTGLDPQARRNFWELVRCIKANGKTILLTTHYMEEAYELCDEIIILDHGKIIAQGAPSDLLAKHFGDAVLMLPKQDFPSDCDQLETLISGDMVTIFSSNVDETIRQLLILNIPLTGLQIRQRTLEDLFLALTGKELRA